MFMSQLRSKEFVIDDSNFHLVAGEGLQEAKNGMRGFKPRDFAKCPFGSMPHAPAFPKDQLIPRSEWTDRIEEMERTKTRLSDIVLQAGVPSMDQDQTNYCWTNALVTAIHAIRARQGLPYIPLSAASVAAPIRGFTNEGGWGTEALEFIIKNGICDEGIWPKNAIARKYYTDAAKANALLYRITEWNDLPPGVFDYVMTCCLLRKPVPIGLSWWGHEVCAFDGVVLGKMKFGIRPRNSWTDAYGDRGFFVLTESKATPDDACAPGIVTAA